MSEETAESSAPPAMPTVVAALVAGCFSTLYYGIDRTLAFLRHGAPNPLGTLASPRIDYFWRIAIAAFIASLLFMAVQTLWKSAGQREIVWLTRTLVVSTLFCSVLAFLFP
jgi:hypothetical protein